MLLSLALESGVEIDFDCEVIDVDPTKPTVTLASGEEIGADIIIGADGGYSLVREALFGDQDEFKCGHLTCYQYVSV